MKHKTSIWLFPISIVAAACSSSAGGGAQVQRTDVSDGVDGGADGGDAASASGDDSATPPVEYDATLAGAQVVPPVITSSTGTGTFLLQPDGVTLTYDISLSVPNATAVDLHLAAPGENGSVTHPLTPVSSHMTGSVTLSSDEQNDIADGSLYVDVQTQANPGGEVRGQLLLEGSVLYVASLTGPQEVPPVTTSNTGHASFILSPDQGSVVYHVVTTASPTDVRLERAIGGLVGPVADDISPAAPTMDGTLQIGMTDPSDLQAGHLYLNVVTSAHPAGELRGQVILPGESLFAGVLSGAAEAPATMSTASGGAQVILDPAHDGARYEVDVSGIIPTEAEIDDSAAGQSGPQLVQLTLASGGASGTTPLAAGAVAALLQGDAYVNVETASYPSGELRAQLAAE